MSSQNQKSTRKTRDPDFTGAEAARFLGPQPRLLDALEPLVAHEGPAVTDAVTALLGDLDDPPSPESDLAGLAGSWERVALALTVVCVFGAVLSMLLQDRHDPSSALVSTKRAAAVSLNSFR